MELPGDASSSPATAGLALHTQGWQGAELAESQHYVAPPPSHCVIALVPVLVPGWEILRVAGPSNYTSRVSQLGRFLERHLAPG